RRSPAAFYLSGRFRVGVGNNSLAAAGRVLHLVLRRGFLCPLRLARRGLLLSTALRRLGPALWFRLIAHGFAPRRSARSVRPSWLLVSPACGRSAETSPACGSSPGFSSGRSAPGPGCSGMDSSGSGVV